MDQREQTDPTIITTQMTHSGPDRTRYEPMRDSKVSLNHHDGIDPGRVEPVSYDATLVQLQLRGNPVAMDSPDDD